MSKPLVSICCLSFNHEKFIQQCLDGFLMQKTDFTYEVLIHDDASTDKTADIIREYEKKHPDIIKPIYQTENQYSKGVAVTRKFNFSRAQGDYIAMCEGDDYWTDPLKLQKQVDFLESNLDYGLCFHNVNVLTSESNTIKPDDYSNNSPEISTIEDLAKKNYINTLSVVLRNDFTLPTFTSGFISGDWALYIIQIKDRKIKRINDTMGVYRIHKGGVWSSITKDDKLKFLINTIQLILDNVPLSETPNFHLRKRLKKLKFKRFKHRIKRGLKLTKS